MCIKIICSYCHKWTWKGCGFHISSALEGIPKRDRCDGWKTGDCPDSTPASAMWSFALDDKSLIPSGSSSAPSLTTNVTVGDLEQRADGDIAEEKDEDLHDFLASLPFVCSDIATENDDIDSRPTIRQMRDFGSIDSGNSSERTTSTRVIATKKRDLGSADSHDSESNRSRLSGSIKRIRKALKSVNFRMFNIIGANNRRTKTSSGKSTTLISEEEQRLDIVNRVIGVLNGADKDEICQFFSVACVNEVTLSSAALPPVVGLRDVIIFWILTFEVYPDGIWEQRAIDLKKNSNGASGSIFKIKYTFSGTRIYADSMKTLYEEIRAGLRDHEGLDETIQSVTVQTANMVIRSSTSGSEQSDQNESDLKLGDVENVLDVNTSALSNQGFCTTFQAELPVALNAEEQAEFDLEQRLINGGSREKPNLREVHIPCTPLDCHGVIWIEFSDTNKIVFMEVDVDTESEFCDKDLWTFTP